VGIVDGDPSCLAARGAPAIVSVHRVHVVALQFTDEGVIVLDPAKTEPETITLKECVERFGGPSKTSAAMCLTRGGMVAHLQTRAARHSKLRRRRVVRRNADAHHVVGAVPPASVGGCSACAFATGTSLRVYDFVYFDYPAASKGSREP